MPVVRLGALILVCGALLPFSALADAQDDLELLRQRASRDRQSEQLLLMLQEAAARGDSSRGGARQIILSYAGMGGGTLSLPLRIDAIGQVQLAETRAQALMPVISSDLDGDGTLTTDEMKVVARFGRRTGAADMFFAFDTNDDGKLTPAEIEIAVNAQTEQQRLGFAERLNAVRLFDLNDDGMLSTDEVDRSERALGIIQKGELPETDRQVPAVSPALKRQCQLPGPSAEALVIVLTGYEGHAISSVSVVGPDAATSAAAITIEPGKKPVYIVTATYDPIVWMLKGATERVERFVVQPGAGAQGGPGVGVTGLPREKVAFAPGADCLGYITETSDTAATRTAAEQVERALGRRPNDIFATYTLANISLPSGAGKETKSAETDIVIRGDKTYALTEDGPVLLEEPKPGADMIALTEQDLRRFYPGGVAQIDPKAVVASGDVAAYPVLPQQAGLIQLMKSGDIMRTGRDDYVIIKQIERFPPGLFGAFSVRFIMGDKFPMPAGNPGHSSVLSEDGECLTRTCR